MIELKAVPEENAPTIEAEPNSCEYWDGESQFCALRRPQAEPTTHEWEWCHDCKEYDHEEHCCHRWTKVIRNTVEEMEKERIVRCEDCKWYEWGVTECHNPRYGDGWANYPPPRVYDEYFCKDGERKDEVEND